MDINDGQYVAKRTKNDRAGKPLEILYDTNGPFVLSQDTDGIRIDLCPAILEAFVAPLPSDGPKYMVHWKDGNKYNNDYTNLEWRPYQYRHSSSDIEMLYRQNNLIGVHRDGSIWLDGREERVLDYHFETDTWIRFPDKKVFTTLDYQQPLYIEDLMCACGYVQGDPDSIMNPVILHKDNNYRNCASDNLEWVDKDDSRYDAFLDQRLKDRMDVFYRENEDHHLPHDKYISESKDGPNYIVII